MLQSPANLPWRTVLTVAGGYMAFGLAWILLSDRIAYHVTPDKDSFALWQSYKGAVFVFLSTGVLLALLWREAVRLRALDRYWQQVVDLAEEAFWLIDAEGRTRAVNRALTALLGYNPQEILGRIPFAFADADSQSVVEHQIGGETEPGLRHVENRPRHYEITLLTREGEPLPMLVHATSLFDGEGRLTGSYAFLTDLSELRARQRELDLTRHAVSQSVDAIFRIAPDGQILDANATACRRLGYDLNELKAFRVVDVDPHFPPEAWQAHWQELKQAGSLSLETEHQTRDGSRFPVEVGVSHITYAGEELAFAVVRDISERKTAEAATKRANHTLRALSRANAALIHAESEAELFHDLCTALTDHDGYPLAWVGMAEDDDERSIRIAGASGQEQGYLGNIRLSWSPETPAGQGPAGRAIRTGKAQVRRDLETAEDFEPWRAAARQHDFSALATLPIHAEGQALGLITVYSSDSSAFDHHELGLLEELASDLGFGIRVLRTRAERDQKMAELRLAGAVFDNTTEGILVTDADSRIQTVNRAFTEITGYSAEEAGGQPTSMFHTDLQDEDFYEAVWANVHSEGYWEGELWQRRKDGTIYPAWLTLSAVREADSEPSHYVAVFADVSRAHQTQEELTYRTYHDPLTGLPNRVLFRERLGHALEDPNHRLAVVLIDLREFRSLNDSFGTEGGDTVLARTARRLESVLPERDTVARPGGDEFWVLLEDLPHSDAVHQRITSLAAAISEPLTVAGQTLRLEANMGVALAPDDGSDTDRLLTSAATALHRAQEEGSGRIHYFRPEMQTAVSERVRIAEALKGALEQGELRVWYQPQVDPATGATVGMEALVRWQHPEWGLVSPGTFIPVAEETGLVAPIGDWVLEQALGQCRYWRAAGYALPSMAVNAAASQLQEPTWAARVAAMLERTGVPAACLEIEITEESVLADLNQAVATMERLKATGIRLAIDDFGTGYSSLAYLKRLPVDTLKIDKAFINGLPEEEYDRSIAEAILAVAGALDISVVAEGVETEAQAEWLRAQGVHLVQGFLYHRPHPSEEAAAALSPAEPGP